MTTHAHRTCLLAGAALLACAAPSAAAEPVNGRIAYSTFESSADPGAGDIWTMNPDGGGKQQAVFDLTNDAQSDWSSDGTKIVYRSRRNSQFEVSIVDCNVRDAVTGRPRIIDIPKAPDGTQSSQPAWYPDMSRLLYRRTNAPGTTRSDVFARHDQGAVLDRRAARRPQHPGHGCRPLSVADTSGVAPGHLVNGTFSLPQPLQVRSGNGTYAPVPADLLAYGGPVSNDVVTIGLKQSIAATDALRTGTYAKTLTFTLSTTAP
jgi:hypothetical protein